MIEEKTTLFARNIFALAALLIAIGFIFGQFIKFYQVLSENRISQERENRLLTSEVFDRKMKCQDIVEQQMDRFNNITGGSYSEYINSCFISYTVDGEESSADVEDMTKQ